MNKEELLYEVSVIRMVVNRIYLFMFCLHNREHDTYFKMKKKRLMSYLKVYNNVTSIDEFLKL